WLRKILPIFLTSTQLLFQHGNNILLSDKRWSFLFRLLSSSSRFLLWLFLIFFTWLRSRIFEFFYHLCHFLLGLTHGMVGCNKVCEGRSSLTCTFFFSGGGMLP
ncbi:unnamed protein product, partial [Prunus brigantina]